jgi:hypothetical protein
MTTLATLAHRFDVFGYLHLPGVLREEIGWIDEEFEHVVAAAGAASGGGPTAPVIPFIDENARLCTLLDHPWLEPVLEALLGRDYNYLGGDGRCYRGDTEWHWDGEWAPGRCFLKVSIYLDRLTRAGGALRVIPGSHRQDDGFGKAARDAHWSEERLGLPMDQVPSVALETEPGDVVIFNHCLSHGAFGGGERRRMFTMNLGCQAVTAEDVDALKGYLGYHLSPWAPRAVGAALRATATPNRMRHLAQVIAHECHLPALHASALARARQRPADAAAR